MSQMPGKTQSELGIFYNRGSSFSPLSLLLTPLTVISSEGLGFTCYPQSLDTDEVPCHDYPLGVD